MARVNYKGEVFLDCHGRIEVNSNMDLRKYPFDEQIVEITMVPWTKTDDQVSIYPYNPELKEQMSKMKSTDELLDWNFNETNAIMASEFHYREVKRGWEIA